MIAEIKGTDLKGEIAAIASKSMAHRYMIASALVTGERKSEAVEKAEQQKASLTEQKIFVECHTSSEDIEATIACLTALGAHFEKKDNGYMITPIDRANMQESMSLPCKESGSTFRFLLPVAATFGKSIEFMQEGRLPKRPLSPLYEEMTGHGVSMSPQGENPFKCEGKLSAGTYRLAGNVTSQFISGLLFALPMLDGDSRIELTSKLESKLYVDMTIAVIRQFGIKVDAEESAYIIPGNQKYISPNAGVVEGDWSNAAFWLSAGAIGSNPITMTGLSENSLQGDKAIINVLKEFGADIKSENGRITVSAGELKGIDIDAADIPDLVPIMAAVAAVADGKTTIYNAERLRLKESDRLKTVSETLNILGADVSETEDGLVINGKRELTGGIVNASGDHRIAMMAAIAALKCTNEVIIENAEAVNKSYPAFFEDYIKLSGKVEYK